MLRRAPTFYAHNPNKERSALKSKFKPEHACVVMRTNVAKRLSHKPGKVETALGYFLRKACIKESLELVGLRTVYMDEEQIKVSGEKFEKGEGLIAIAVRGIDAKNKVNLIVGHFNPEMAKKTCEMSISAFFGIDNQNCMLGVKTTDKKQLQELTFWFGGRIATTEQTPKNPLYTLVPSRREKIYMLLSPIVGPKQVGAVVSALNKQSLSIQDIRLLNLNQLYFDKMGPDFRRFGDIRLRKMKVRQHRAFLLKVSGESLPQKLSYLLKKLAGALDTEVNQFVFTTTSKTDYKQLKRAQDQIFKDRFFYACSGKPEGEESQTEESKLSPEKMQSEASAAEEARETKPEAGATAFKRWNIPFFETKPKKMGMKANQSEAESIKTATVACFISMSAFKKQIAGGILNYLLASSDPFELLACRVVRAKDVEQMSADMAGQLKATYYNFYEKYHLGSEEELLGKVARMEMLMLVLERRRAKQFIESVFDPETFLFNDDAKQLIPELETEAHINIKPAMLFATNPVYTQPLIDYLARSKFLSVSSVGAAQLLDNPEMA